MSIELTLEQLNVCYQVRVFLQCHSGSSHISQVCTSLGLTLEQLVYVRAILLEDSLQQHLYTL